MLFPRVLHDQFEEYKSRVKVAAEESKTSPLSEENDPVRNINIRQFDRQIVSVYFGVQFSKQNIGKKEMYIYVFTLGLNCNYSEICIKY